jgi:hypothetical protein
MAADLWHLKTGSSGAELHCRHPRPLRALISQVRLQWTEGACSVQERPRPERRRSRMAVLAEHSQAPSRIEAELDLGPELRSLQRLPPGPGALEGWLSERRRQQRRWRGLLWAASSADPVLVAGAAYEQRLLPLLLRHALLHTIPSDPALAVLMGLSPRGRQLYGWLEMVRAAATGGTGVEAVLQLRGIAGVGVQERLLALQQLATAGAAAALTLKPGNPPLPLLQYWEGEPVPADVEAMLEAWPRQLPDLQPERLDAAGAQAWIERHGAPGDPERFRRCWHPAMQSDFLRVLHVARQGGLYLDCDTPVPTGAAERERWRQLALHCCSSHTLALCVNAVRQPGDLRYYVVNCCLWAPAGHPLLQGWLEAYRQRLDTLPAELVNTPRGIHRLGPELVSELVDGVLQQPGGRLAAVDWEGVRLPRWQWQGAELLLVDTQAYRALFGVPFSCHASYQSCHDPRDWKVGVRP